MGNFEKLVVLLILLVCAVVLGISLRATDPLPIGEDEVHAGQLGSQLGDPIDEPTERAAPRRPQVPPEAPVEVAETGRPSLQDPRGTSEPEEAPLPTLMSLVEQVGADESRKLALVRADDLRKTVSPDYMLYTCRSGDSWTSLASYYYGASNRDGLLRVANETIEQLEPGQQLLVPKYDVEFEARRRDRAAPRILQPPPRDEVASGTPRVAGGGNVRSYVVESGDTLSEISSAVYGTSGRWMEIYDANRDKLASPHALKVGATLTIP